MISALLPTGQDPNSSQVLGKSQCSDSQISSPVASKLPPDIPSTRKVDFEIAPSRDRPEADGIVCSKVASHRLLSGLKLAHAHRRFMPNELPRARPSRSRLDAAPGLCSRERAIRRQG